MSASNKKVRCESTESQGSAIISDDSSSVFSSIIVEKAPVEFTSVPIPEATSAKKAIVSMLNPYTIRWLNRHHPKQAFMTPSRAIFFHEIFKGLDFDGSGSISMKEMEEALSYVGKSGVGLNNPEQLKSYFRSMDKDKDGSIDFPEFMAGMSTNSSTSGVNQAEMQSAFAEFAQKQKRELVIRHINDSEVEDSVKAKGFMDLFLNRKAIVTGGNTIDEAYKNYTEEIEKEKNELGPDYFRREKVQHTRAKASRLKLEQYKQAEREHSIQNLIRVSKLDSAENIEFIASRAQSKLSDRLSRFSVIQPDPFSPNLSVTKSLSKLPLLAVVEAREVQMRQTRLGESYLPPMPMKQKIAMFRQEARERQSLSSDSVG